MAASKAIGFLNFKFSADLTAFERAMNKAQKKLKKFGKSVERTGKNMTMGLTLPILSMGVAALKFGSDLQETDSKFKQVFSSIQEEAEKTAQVFKDSFGLSELAAKQLLSDTGDLLVGFGFTEKAALELSTQVNELAVDLASFTNFEGGAEGASRALTKALVGETESAKSLGIVIRQGTKEYKDRTKEIMKEEGVSILQAKAMNNLEIATNQSQKAIGDFSRTQGDFANQLRIVKGDLVDVAAEFGTKLIPYAQAAIEKFKILIQWFDGLSDSQQNSIIKWGLIVAAIGPVLIIIGRMSVGISALIGAFKGLSKWVVANPYLALAAGITVAVVAFTDLGRKLFGVSDAQRAVNDINKKAARAISDQKTEVAILTTILEDENTSLTDKETALKKLQEISPKYYGSLSIAKGKVEGLDTATKNYTASILQQAKAVAAQEKLMDLHAQMLEVELKKTIQFAGANYTQMFKDNIQEQIDAVMDMVVANEKLEDSGKSIWDPFIEATEEAQEELEELEEDFEDLTKETKMYSDALEVLSTDFLFMKSSVGDQFKGMLFWTKELTKEQKLATAGWMMFGDVLTSSLDESLDSQEKFFTVFVKNIKKAIRSLLVQLAVMTLIKALMPGSLGGLGKAAFSIANITKSLGSIMNVEGFATGGLVTGPTTALIGEGIGTTASNPEVVAPLDKLKSMIGGKEQNITVTGKLVGNDIFLSNTKTGFNRLRTV